MNEEKIISQFHYFNINSELDSLYGNWAVSKDGDVVNCLYPYAIFSIHLVNENWLEKVKSRIWFKQECEDSFIQALERAKEIINK